MGINEEQLELLVGELQKLRTHMAGMLETSTQSTVALERIDKTLIDQQKDDQVDDSTETASYTPDASIADDIQKTIDAHNDLVGRAKAETEEEKQKEENEAAEKAALDALQLREDQLAAQEESNEGQMQTNDYLRVLAELTQKNDDRLENGSKGDKPKLDAEGNLSNDTIGSSLLERALVRSGKGGNDITGGIGGIMTGFREMGMSLKRGKDNITGVGSRRRQKKIKNEISLINRDKAILSAEADKMDKLRGGGASELSLAKNQSRIDKLKEQIRGRSETFGDLTATEHMYQKGRADKNFRKMGKDDKGLLLEQTKGNIARSVMVDVDPIYGSDSDTKKKDSKGGLKSKFSVFNKNAGGDAVNTNKNRTEAKKENASLFSTSLASSTNPKTYGEYISGIYNELESLNNILEGGMSQQSPSVVQQDSGGGMVGSIFSMLGGSILGGLGSMFLKKGKFGKLGKATRNAKARNLRKMRSTKAGRAALKAKRAKNAAKVAKGGKGLLKGGLKTGLTKTAAKGLGKGLLKKIPGVGLIIGLGLAASELASGNYGRALLEAGSGIASTIPGAGTAVSLALDGALMADDAYGTPNAGAAEAANVGGAITGSNNGFDGGEFGGKGSGGSWDRNDSAMSKQRTVRPKTTVRSVDSANSNEQLARMELQARLNANEISKIFTSSQYNDVQTQIAKAQGAAVAQATFG